MLSSPTRNSSQQNSRKQNRRERIQIEMDEPNEPTRSKANGLQAAAAAAASKRTIIMRKRATRFENQVALFVVISLFAISSGYLSICQAAVIRPTVFSDLNTSQQDNNAQQQQQQANAAAAASQPQTQQQQPLLSQQQQQQLQLQQQQQQQQQLQQSQQSNLNTLSADGSQIAAGQQQTPATSTKISPLKSRFCVSSANQRFDQPLGLQSFAIDDLALSSSSSSNEQVRPHLARLNLDIRGGAWCPANAVHVGNFGKEWIQVKLNRSHVITALETQGRFGMGNGREFVPSYQVEYSRNGGRTWHKWKDLRGSNLLRANEDTNSAVKNELSPPIVGANVIRILPYSHTPRTVCMRLELHGCLFDEGAPVAYSTQEGVVEPRWGHLIDYTYDGLRLPGSGELSHGLGQLVDGVKGPDNFSFNNGFEWVGWKSMNGDVVIEFTFRTLRNFTGALFHSNNLFSSGVEVFQAVDVHYGIDVPYSMEALKDSIHEQHRRRSGIGGSSQQKELLDSFGQATAAAAKHTLWSQDVLSIEYEPDKKSEAARPVTVHLKQRLANKLKFVLKFASKWILVSEVEFLSHPVELLSLASLNEHQTSQLMSHLMPAKSYDEYVAILRDHQLRRLAAETLSYMNPSVSQGPQSNTPAAAAAAAAADMLPSQADSSNDQPPSPSSGEQQTQASSERPVLSSLDQVVAYSQQSKPLVSIWPPPPPPTPKIINQNINMDLNSMPSTNPLLNQNLFVGPNPLYAGPSAVESSPVDSASSLKSQLLLGDGQRQLQAGAKQQSSSSAASSPIGLTTVISFVLVSVVIFLAILFVVSSYRMRNQPKLARHLSLGTASGNNGKQANLVGPRLHNFMSVFSSPPAAATAINQQQQRRQQQHTNDNQYNAIFASQTTQRHHNHQLQRPASALKRLATLASSSSNKSNHPLLASSANGVGGTNQLLVSVKDSPNHSSTGLFGGSAAIKQGINTQLIIGLNQPSSNHLLYGNQTYATHYSTSMSMASSSTNGGQQGDYGDYAIPDATPMIPSNLAHQYHAAAAAAHHHSTMNHLHHQQQQQPFVSRLSNGGQQVRSSLIQQPTNVIQQQHNYEPVYSTAELINNGGAAISSYHTRTLSNQLAASSNNNNNNPICANNNQQAFNSMTLTSGSRFIGQPEVANRTNNSKNLLGSSNQQQQLLQCEGSSPGGSSGQSGATTATTSINSATSSNNTNQADHLQAANHHYYYAASTSETSQQQQQQPMENRRK